MKTWNVSRLLDYLKQLDLVKNDENRRGYYFIRSRVLDGQHPDDTYREYTTISFKTAQFIEKFCTWEVINFKIVYETKDASYLRGLKIHSQPFSELRRISRNCYHSTNPRRDGQRTNVQAALDRIAADGDGVKRSFGLEFEVYTLTPQQEDKLARFLDSLPEHECEGDASLGMRGVEIVFAPMDAQTYIETVKKLQEFVRENNIQMSYDINGNGAGMHTTYGVNNSEATKSDIQIRLNRYALAILSICTKQQIKQVFGRTFGNYREVTTNLLYNDHSNAFSINGRNETCWECRLPNYQADPEALVKLFKIMETVFHRPTKAEDFTKLFEVFEGGADL